MQAEVRGQRCGFAGNAFHHVAVAADGVGAVIHEVVAGLIEARSEPTFGDGEADAGGEALAERPGAYVFAFIAELMILPVYTLIGQAPFLAAYKAITEADAA